MPISFLPLMKLLLLPVPYSPLMVESLRDGESDEGFYYCPWNSTVRERLCYRGEK